MSDLREKVLHALYSTTAVRTKTYGEMVDAILTALGLQGRGPNVVVSRAIVEEGRCPSPAKGRPNDETAKTCINSGNCGCVYGKALGNQEDTNDI